MRNHVFAKYPDVSLRIPVVFTSMYCVQACSYNVSRSDTGGPVFFVIAVLLLSASHPWPHPLHALAERNGEIGNKAYL